MKPLLALSALLGALAAAPAQADFGPIVPKPMTYEEIQQVERERAHDRELIGQAIARKMGLQHFTYDPNAQADRFSYRGSYVGHGYTCSESPFDRDIACYDQSGHGRVVLTRREIDRIGR